MEYCPFDFLIKDLATHTSLGHNRSRNRLYEWRIAHSSSSLQANMASTNNSTEIRHHRLSYSLVRILKFILDNFTIPIFVPENFKFLIHVYPINLIGNHLFALLCQVPNLFKPSLVICETFSCYFNWQKIILLHASLLTSAQNTYGFTLYIKEVK